MPVKKTVKKAPAKKPEAKKAPAKKPLISEKQVNDVKKQIREEAKFVKKESEVIASGIGKWWTKSSTEEKIYTFLGIIALVWGLYVLADMIWGLLLIIVGILFVTGYFAKKE